VNTTIQTSNLLSSLPMVWKKIFCFFVSYFNGEVYRFVLTTSGELALEKQKKTDKQPLILIVSRPFYSEQTRTYPVDNKSELKKLLALELSELTIDEKANTYYHNWGSDSSLMNGSSKVNLWKFQNIVPSAFLQLPESLLLAITIKNTQIIQKQETQEKSIQKEGTQNLYITRLGDTIYSLVQTNIISSVQRFAMSVGISQVEDTKIIENNNLAEQLALGMKKLPLPLVMDFIQLPQVESRLSFFKKIFIPSLFVIIMYLFASSGYLSYKLHSLQGKLESQKEEVSSTLQNQINFDQKLTRYTALQKFLSTQKNYSPVWLIMADLFPVAQFTNIRIEQKRFVIRGSSVKATQVLDILSKNERVKNAKFDFPTRRNRNRDVFVISFDLVNIKNEGDDHG